MFVLIIAGIVAIGLLVLSFRYFNRKRLIDDTPTSKTQGVFIGMAEVKGTAESDSPLVSYLGGIKCVYYKWHIDEHWSRTETSTSTDSRGHTHVSTRQSNGWTTVAKGVEFCKFYLKDDTGVLQVNPDGAEVNAIDTFNRTCTMIDPLYFGKGPLEAVANSDGRRRFIESALPLHSPLYIMGHAHERQDIVAAEIAKDKGSPLFLISTRTEKQISSRFGIFFWLCFIFGLLSAAGGTLTWEIVVNNNAAPWENVLIATGGYLFLAVLAWLWIVYNSLIGLNQSVKQGWSQVDVQLKRRHDLIPNLVSCVQGFKNHEKETQTLVTELRAQMEATPPGTKGPDYKGLLPLLKATAEQYPELKSNMLFLSLQKSLTETEQRIALARDYYNEAATNYNTRLQIFPDRFVAWMAYLKPRLLLSASDFERAPVNVKLAA
jgi:hypothetical protein